MYFGHQEIFRNTIDLRCYWYINIIVRVLFYMNSITNPILFNCLSTKFRVGMRGIFKFNAKAGSKVEALNRAHSIRLLPVHNQRRFKEKILISSGIAKIRENDEKKVKFTI